MGMGATNTEGRIAASLGRAGSVQPHFIPSEDVVCAGVLFALPALLATGLLKYTDEYFKLKNGYYDIHTYFILLAFMALCRIQSMEKLRYEPPGEWGKLLGLDRIPEVKTLREKVDKLSQKKNPFKWSAALSNQWLSKVPEGMAAFYVDGHVRVYHGSQTKLPRHFVSRVKLCLRANCDYWVNEMDGQPFFVVNRVIDPGLIKTMEHEIVPTLENSTINQPSERELEEDPYLHRFTLIYDREGYSPDFMARMWKKRIACKTYAKNVKDEWRESEFQKLEVIGNGGEVTYEKLAERGVFLRKKIWVREVRRLRADGRQTTIHSTEYRADIRDLAKGMFARWSQENFFKYMRQNFGIDRLVTYSLEDIPDTTEVVNPEYRDVSSQIRKDQGLLQRKLKEYGTLNYEEKIESQAMKKYINRKEVLTGEMESMENKIKALKERRKSIDKKIKMKDLPEDAQFKTLATQSKHLIDTIKMVAYRAETGMAYTLKEKMHRKDDARSLLQAIYQNEADIIPDYEKKTLTVRLHHLANKSSMDAVRFLCSELNATQTIFPGSDLTLIYEVVSKQNPRGQEL